MEVHEHGEAARSECGAVLDASAILKLVDEETFLRGKTLLVRIVQMLVKMTQ